MSRKSRFEIKLFNMKSSVKASFESQEEAEEFCQYLEKLIRLSTDEKGAQALANKLFQDKALLKMILNIGYELYNLKKRFDFIEAELGERLDEALRILEKIKLGED